MSSPRLLKLAAVDVDAHDGAAIAPRRQVVTDALGQPLADVITGNGGHHLLYRLDGLPADVTFRPWEYGEVRGPRLPVSYLAAGAVAGGGGAGTYGGGGGLHAVARVSLPAEEAEDAARTVQPGPSNP